MCPLQVGQNAGPHSYDDDGVQRDSRMVTPSLKRHPVRDDCERQGAPSLFREVERKTRRLLPAIQLRKQSIKLNARGLADERNGRLKIIEHRWNKS